MCDDLTENDNQAFENAGGAVNRRDFSTLSAAGILSLMLPNAASAQGGMSVSDREVNVPMADGVSDSYFVAPTSGKHPGVLIWPDIRGLRPAFKAMGKRLAMQGYAVLVANPFYRDGPHPHVAPGEQFSDPDVRARVIPMARKLTQDASMSDARDYIRFLDVQGETDTTRKVGTMGYCMGGPLIMRTAGAVPDRVGAAASFHGGGLVTNRPDSPHLLIPTSPAHVLHAVAENDDERNPTQKVVLAETYAANNIPAEIEVYEGTLHGWCPPDSSVYNQSQAERAWARTLALFSRALS